VDHITNYLRSRRDAVPLGLMCFIGAVCRQHVHEADVRNLDSRPLPDNETDRESYVKFRNDLVSNARALKVAWLDGTSSLPLDSFRETFPKTFQDRSKTFVRPENDRPRKGNYGGAYALPLGPASSPLEAVRAGSGALGEWASREAKGFESEVRRVVSVALREEARKDDGRRD
jgi:hypothetical protein